MASSSEYNRQYYAKNRERERARGLAKYHQNPAASKARIKAWKEKSPEIASRSRHKTNLRQYGLTEATYQELLQSQGCVCAICRRPETVSERGKVRRLTVDHCHVTGRVRGLLCSRCNILLGYAKDDATVLLAASIYLEKKP